MSKFEKKFVNSQKHAATNIKKVEALFKKINVSNIQNVLEIGCGAGMLANYLSEKYQMKATGTDVDPEQIDLAVDYHRENNRLTFLTMNATDLRFQDTEFDLVLSFMVMHHINDWKKAMEEINRVLKRGGIFIIKDLSFSPITSRLLGPFAGNYGIYAFNEMTHSLEKMGFSLLFQESPKGVLFKQFSLVLQKL